MKNSTVALLRDALARRVYIDYDGVRHIKRRYDEEDVDGARMTLNDGVYTLKRYPNGLGVVEAEDGAVAASALLHTLNGVLAFNVEGSAQEFVDRYGGALNVLAFWSETFETVHLVRDYDSPAVNRAVVAVYDTWLWCASSGELRLSRRYVELDEERFIIRPYYDFDRIAYVRARRNATIADAILYDKWENARVTLESPLFEEWLL